MIERDGEVVLCGMSQPCSAPPAISASASVTWTAADAPKMSPHGAPPVSGISSAISSFGRASCFSSLMVDPLFDGGRWPYIVFPCGSGHQPAAQERSALLDSSGARVMRDNARPEFLSSLYCADMRDVVEQTWGWDDAWQLAEVESRAVGGRRFL